MNQAVAGIHLEESHPLSANTAVIGLKHLASWVDPDLISHEQPSYDEATVTGDATSVEDDSIQLDDGIEVSILRRVYLETTKEKQSVGQYCLFKLRSEGAAVDLDSIMERARWMQELVSFGVGNARTAQFKTVVLRRDDLLSDAPLRDQKRMDYFANWSATDASDKESPDPALQVMPFTDAGGMEFVARWMKFARKHDSSLARVAATKSATTMFISDRFLHRVIALEGLDRVETGRNRDWLRTRLTRCIGLAGDPFSSLVSDEDYYVRRVKDLRNSLAHDLGRDVVDSSEQYAITESLYWLYMFCALRLAGASETAIKRVERCQTLSWLAPNIRAVTSEPFVEP